MDVYALFDDRTFEQIHYKFLEPDLKSDRVEILFLGSVQNNVRESVDKAIKETYILLTGKIKHLNKKLSIWFRGFDKDVQGNSMDLAFSISFITHLIKNKYLKTTQKIPTIFATGVITADGKIQAVDGLEDKLCAISYDRLKNTNCMLIYPMQNHYELDSLRKKDPHINLLLKELILVPINNLHDIIDIFKLESRSTLKDRFLFLMPKLVIALSIIISFFLGHIILPVTPNEVTQNLTKNSPNSINSANNTISDDPENKSNEVNSKPIIWYKFDAQSGTKVLDSSGNKMDGTLKGGATWIKGRSGNAVNLNGHGQYIYLPEGIINGLNDFTISQWVKINSVNTWSRIFDFGSGTRVNMFLASSSGSTIRYAITKDRSFTEQQINSTKNLPLKAWTHLVITQSDTLGTIYVDGVEVGKNTLLTLNPSSLTNVANNYIGKSQYDDPYLDGQIDNFRIYNYALSPSEIKNLFKNGL